MNSSFVQNSSRVYQLNIIRFWPLVISNILSIICSLFLLCVLLFDRNVRQTLNNHIIIVLLLVNLVSQLVDNPAYLNYLRINIVWPSTSATCIVWILAGYQFYVTSTLFVALASIQRHILVFHQQWVATRRRRMIIHYLPMIAILLYCVAYGATIVVLFLKDGFAYDYTQRMCGNLSTWIQNYNGLMLWDVIVNELLPVPMIIIFSIALLMRILKQRRRMHRQIGWRKQRKMTIQLLSIAALFSVINLPPILLYVIDITVDRTILSGMNVASSIFRDLTYYQSVLLPFVCLASLWNSAKKMFNKTVQSCVRLRHIHTTAVVPISNRTTQRT